MSIIGKKKKQPLEIKEFPVSFSEFFVDRADAILSVSVSVDAGTDLDGEPGNISTSPGMTVSGTLVGLLYVVVAKGGTSRVKYKVTATLRGTPTLVNPDGILVESEFYVTVQEV